MDCKPFVLTVKKDSFTAKDESILKEIPNDLRVEKAKSIEPFEIYKKFTGKKKNELIESETISGENKSLAHQISIWIRLNLFVPDARVGWYFSAIQKGKKILERNKFDIIVSFGPPHQRI